jgi:hypothetical protein
MTKPTLLPTLVAAALVALTTVPSALIAQEPAQFDEDRAESEDRAVVRVTNHNWMDMHVYLIRDGGPRQSIGVVGSFQSAELALPLRALDSATRVRIVADPIGARGVYVSPEIIASPADDVILTLQNSLPLSFMTVQRRIVPEAAES